MTISKSPKERSKITEQIETAQAEIRKIILDGYLNHDSGSVIQRKIEKEIKSAIRNISITRLRVDAARSLTQFAGKQYRTLLRAFGRDPTFLVAISAVANVRSPTKQQVSTAQRQLTLNGYRTEEKGVPLQKYAKDYFDKNITPVLQRLARENALDPNDQSGRNSLRNLAEMEVRYEANMNRIEELKSKGVRIVVSSVHSDCSDRCYPYQGKAFSLDGSYGVTEDGRRFEPITTATDIFYTTKAGRTYKNGLLGFNCRHTLLEYFPGMKIPVVSRAQQKYEYKVTKRQRELERYVRQWEAEAQTFKKLYPARYRFCKR